ncbi:MAG TPA: CocE/NonD family hydrolase [Mycobacteriales bacterium]|nr:CocE/NonD family hydrolase [Mycobacteriales bacterium]
MSSRAQRPALALVLALAAVVGVSTASAAPDRRGGAFEPAPASKPIYETKGPEADPANQRHIVKAGDGVNLYVETWLPAPSAGRVPPKRLPTILIMTPYVKQGKKRYSGERHDIIAYFTQRGYAVAQGHVRGTGESGGCLEQTAAKQIDDGARLVEYLGRDAPWASGKVGMYGISYDAETQLSVAGLGDKMRTSYLKAIIPVASVAGQYEYSNFDGVPYAGQAVLSNAGYLATTSATPGATSTPQQLGEKAGCQPELFAMSADPTGNMTAGWMSRELRAGISRITAATLYVHGLVDFNVQPIALAGMLDRIPKSTPHKGVVGVWDHAFPDAHGRVAPELARQDWLAMATAWYDRYLKGLPTKVESWPTVQIQASDGTWRAEPSFPGYPGPVGQLALSASGGLGATLPTGSTTYVEATAETANTSTSATFTTPALRAPLHLSGQPVLDLWLTTDRPDGHIAASIQVIGANGAVLKHTGGNAQEHATYGFRSLQHLEPIRENWFRQTASSLPAVNTPLRVPVRFHPMDLVVPADGRLRVTISGALSYSRDSLPSGTASRITLLHDCTNPSTLRFLMPTANSLRLDVREEETGRLKGVSQARRGTDGGGIAENRVCGAAPLRLDSFRPTRELVGR